ncbi:MAG: SufS family cysteine desulfurase [Actinomycetia bacterium]|nr:SufS family cysteine desulfurase [Actinomycetes bacterium]MCP4958827.1 SufS family cysteine desulfurase [Actinomycetes bacterium]
MTHDLDVASIRADFPILSRRINNSRLVFLDSAASSQKPKSVLEAMDHFYKFSNANVHRGAYTMATEATDLMESARSKVARFIGAPSTDEIIFTKNVTEALNLVARSWGGDNLGPGDAVLVTEMEHHANIVPWHIMADQKGFDLRWIPITENGHLDLSDLDRLLDGVSLVSFTATSNVLGTINPIRHITDAAHAAGALVMVDGAQYVPHLPTDVVELGIDLFAFTGHKMLGPTGIGCLWGKSEVLEAMPPFLGGGEMILDVRKDGFTTNTLPHKFEAGTPPIAEIVGLGAAVDYLDNLGMDNVRAHEVSLTAYALRTLEERFGDSLTIHGPSEPASRGGLLSLDLAGTHPHDVSQVLDQHGICVRAGHHCAKPLMRALGVNATSRASLYVYNDESDVDALADALEAAKDFFAF